DQVGARLRVGDSDENHRRPSEKLTGAREPCVEQLGCPHESRLPENLRVACEAFAGSRLASEDAGEARTVVVAEARLRVMTGAARLEHLAAALRIAGRQLRAYRGDDEHQHH